MASKATDSDASSMTPSEQSEGDERSEHDSDYGSDQEEDDDSLQSSDCQKDLNIQWTGYGKKTPVLLFNADALFIKKLHMRTVGERYHMAFKFGNTECKVVRNILASHGFHEVHPNSPDFNLLWTNSHLKPFTLRCLTEFQKINHFPRSYELTRKDRLYKNINKMQQIKGAKYFDFIPTSFVLPAEYQDFCSAFLKDKGPWIVKPVASSRGRGVFLVNHPDQVPLEENIIVSKYIPNPVLIDGFKFDVRLYVAVTSYDPLLIYMYEEGLTRFATVRYEKSNRQLRNQCMHLTNYSVNKKSQDYVKNDDPNVEDYGNKWSMGAMLRYLKSQGRDTTAMMMRIEDVVIKTILSVELSIATACKMFMPNRGNCFELYGFDVLIDENLKPWLLEVNLSPSLACDSPLDMKIKANMLCDLFSLVGFVCHDPMMRATQQSRRNQEITAKMAHRSKSARVRRTAQVVRQRPSSAGSSSREKQGQGNRNLQGLNSEEIKILRRVKEEEQRCAGWIRIFPSLDSWDVYSPFLQFNTPHNLMLHQRLYPDRHKSNMGTSGKGSATAVTSVGSRSKQTYLQITGNPGGKIDQERAIESYAQALGRVRQYERRLGSRKHKRKRGKAQKRTPQISVKADKPKLVQGVAEDEDSASQQQESDTEKAESDRTESERTDSRRTDCQRGESRTKMETEKKRAVDQPRASEPDISKAQNKDQKSEKVEALQTSASTPIQPGSGSRGEEVLSQQTMTPSQAELPADSPPPSPSSLMAAAARYNVVELLQKGCILRQEQARLAFAMYLVRVQQRLLADGNPMSQEGVEAVNEQMDLVLRFLRRAAVNLNQAFRVVVPSRKLPLLDRRRILAKQLGDFVHIYSKETEQLRALKLADAKSTRPGLGPSCGELDEKKFDKFVQHASESELEEVLTTYTKLNKSASIFLGGSSFPRGGGENINKSNASANPMPTPSMPSATTATPSTSPALTAGGKRRSSFDIPDPRGVATWDEMAKARSGSHSDVRGALGHGGGVPTSVASTSNTPGAGILSNTYASAVSIYTQRLVRPRSASIGNPKPAISRHLTSGSRPTSATSKPSAPTSYTTVQPTVDTYNEQAIQDALQRLTQRQQARQYSAHNGTTPLFHEPAGSGPPSSIPTATTFTDSSTVSVVAVSSHNQTLSHTGGLSAKPSENARPTQRPPRFVTMEEHQSMRKPPPGKTTVAPSPPGKLPPNTQLPPRPASSSGASQTGNSAVPGPTSSASAANVNLQNANNTFNSFIEDGSYPWHSDLVHAYNQVTGVSPQHYHQASAGSRQLVLAQEQAMRKQRMLEQSRSLLEQNKAKHQAMVAQAHSAQRSNVLPSPPRSVDLPHPSDLTYGAPTFTPKPPVQPSAGKKSASAHRLSRTSVPDDIGISFYNSLKYDIHTGQTKPRGTDG